MVRALASHQCVPSSILARCHTWVEFVVGSHLAPRVILQVPGKKSTSPNSNSTRIEEPYENQPEVASSLLEYFNLFGAYFSLVK